jgi:hypothetical protein
MTDIIDASIVERGADAPPTYRATSDPFRRRANRQFGKARLFQIEIAVSF